MPDISKVILNGDTLMDVTQDTVDAGNLLAGETATMNNGTRTVGTLSLEEYALKAMLATEEATSTASKFYDKGYYLIYNNDLCMVTSDISPGDTISSSNTETVLLAEELQRAYGLIAGVVGAPFYEPTGYASYDYPDGTLVLCGDGGLYITYDIFAGDYIPSGPEVVQTDILYQIGELKLSKASKSSPTFTGTPTAPTAASGTNTTQIATTAFVHAELADATAKEIIKVNFGTLTGTGASVTASKSNAAITAGHELIGYSVGTSSAQVGTITVTTGAGTVQVQGAINGSTTLVIYLGLPGTSVT